MNERVEPSGAKTAIVTASFKDRDSAERAYESIASRGYGKDEIHVLMSDDTRKRLFGKDSEHTDMGHKAMKGAGVGGAVGGVVGATLMAVVAATAAVTLPGLGLVIAGPIAGALAGGAAGGATGGLVGMLVGAGIPETRAKLYETDLKQGGIVLGVKPRHAADVKYFNEEWNTTATHLMR